jgi:uncharacterized membrane protein
MAGIGFELRRLSERDEVLGPVLAMGHAALVAAGPWLLTVTALAVLSAMVEPLVAGSDLEGFRLVVIYAFAVSLVAASPVILVAARQLGDAVYARRFTDIGDLFCGTAVLAVAAATIAATGLFVLVVSIPADLAVTGVALSGAIALVWTGLSFCGAIHQFRAITRAFLVGLVVAVGLATAAAAAGLGVVAMLWAFQAGMVIVMGGLTARVLATFPPSGRPLAEAIEVLRTALAIHWRLALGATFGAIAVFADKWVVWIGPAGVVDATGLVHAPIYDSAMFIACLTIIPALAMFVMHIETDFAVQQAAVRRTIAGHATLGQIRRKLAQLEQGTWRAFLRIVIMQAGITTMVVLATPAIVAVVSLGYQQVGILRLGALASLFQFVFIAATALLLNFNRQAEVLVLQALFLVLQVGCTLAAGELGAAFLGYGTLAASVLAGTAAVVVLDRTMRDLPYIVFILANRTSPRPPMARPVSVFRAARKGAVA